MHTKSRFTANIIHSQIVINTLCIRQTAKKFRWHACICPENIPVVRIPISINLISYVILIHIYGLGNIKIVIILLLLFIFTLFLCTWRILICSCFILIIRFLCIIYLFIWDIILWNFLYVINPWCSSLFNHLIIPIYNFPT